MILSSNLSAKLQKLGVKSTTGTYWDDDGEEIIEDIDRCWYEPVPTYFISDLIRQSEKVFGKEERYTEENYKESKGLGRLGATTPNGLGYWEYGIKKEGYKYHSHKITDLLLSNTSQEDIEAYILEEMKC